MLQLKELKKDLADASKESLVNMSSNERTNWLNKLQDRYVKYSRTLDDAVNNYHTKAQEVENKTVNIREIFEKGISNVNAKFNGFKKEEFNVKHNKLWSPQLDIGGENDPMNMIQALPTFENFTYTYALYEGMDILNRIVDAPIEEALRKEYEIIIDDEEAKKFVMQRLDELKVYDRIFSLLQFGDLSPRGALLVPIEDERGNILSLNVLPDYTFTFWAYNAFPLHVGYNEPQQYIIVNKLVNANEGNYFFHYLPRYNPIYQRGVSVVSRIIDAVKALNIAEWSFTIMILQSQFKYLQYPADALGKVDSDRTTEQLEDSINAFKNSFTSKSVVSIPTDWDVSVKSAEFPQGIQFIIDFLYNHLAIVSETPKVVFLGSEFGQISSAEKNMRQYYEMVKRTRIKKGSLPAFNFIVEKLLTEYQSKNKSADKEKIKFDIDVKPLKELDENEELAIKQSTLNMVNLLAERKYISEEEAKQMLIAKNVIDLPKNEPVN